MDLLKRELAPISDNAWQQIENEAKNTLALHLSGRRIVDIVGPLGLETAAVNLGRLEVPENQPEDLRFGIRKVLPMIEVRVPFNLDIWELDNLDRGGADPDMEDLKRASKELAKFEERAVYEGFPHGAIAGLTKASNFEPVAVKPEPGSLPEAAARAALKMRYADVEGPYALALGAALYQWLDTGCDQGYPLRKRISDQIGGPIVLAPYLDGGLLISQRGGDAELTLGQDTSIGYQSHDEGAVRLFLTESFTFRVVGPEAVVVMNIDSN